MNRTICFVSEAFISDLQTTITGPTVQMYVLGKELMARGWEVHFIAYAGAGVRPGVENYEGLTVHRIRRIRFFQFLNYFGMMRALRSFACDRYYQRGREVFTGFVACHCKVSSKKFVWASSGESGVERGKYLTQWRKKNRPFFRKIVLWVEAKINDRVYAYGIRNAWRIVVQTETQKMRLKNEFGSDSVVIRSGHPVPEKSERALPLKILWIGSIKPIKRPDLFIELARACSDLKCEFWMAGQIADPGYGEPLISMAKGLKNFTFLGGIPFQDSQKVISSAHILVNTTEKGHEGVPNAFVQAWLAGTATWTFTSDPDGVIKKFGLGDVENDLQRIKTQIKKMIDDPPLGFALSEKVQRYGRENFSITTIADRIEELLAE